MEHAAKVRPTKCRWQDCKTAPIVFFDVPDDKGKPETWAFCDPHATQFEKDAEEDQYAKARKDFNKFAELVCVDDVTGQPIKQAPIHRKWAQLCDQYDRLIIWSHVEAGKTTQLSILRTVWELGNDPTLRFVILSDTNGQAVKIVKAIAGYIANNATVRKIFPKLEPHPDGPWTGTELTVVRGNFSKDPSVRAFGTGSEALRGGRVDRLVIDDILNMDNTKTEAARKALDEWIKSNTMGRLTARARVLIVGTAFHPKDLLHEFAKSPRWKYIRFPVINSKGVIPWADAWPQERIALKRVELGPAEFARQCLCVARDDSDSRFKQAWIDAALRRGEGLLDPVRPELYGQGGYYQSKIEDMPEGCATFTGTDIAIKKSKKADKTAHFTFIERPNGDRMILDIEAGKFTGPEIVGKIIDKHRDYQSIQAVENNAAQDFILQFARDISNVPVVPHTTNSTKRDPLLGVEGLAIELANGKWIFPCKQGVPAPEVEAFIQELLYYSPQAHTGDRLMACYFARERARKMLGRGAGPANVVFRAVGTDGSTKAATGEDFNTRINTVSDVSDEEARARDGRPGTGG